MPAKKAKTDLPSLQCSRGCGPPWWHALLSRQQEQRGCKRVPAFGHAPLGTTPLSLGGQRVPTTRGWLPLGDWTATA
eukprot:4049248-Pyramimonas_sp.AAC.1